MTETAIAATRRAIKTSMDIDDEIRQVSGVWEEFYSIQDNTECNAASAVVTSANQCSYASKTSCKPKTFIAQKKIDPYEQMLHSLADDPSVIPIFIRNAFHQTDFSDHNRMLVVHFAVLNGVHFDTLDSALSYNLGENYYIRNRRQQVMTRFKSFFDHGRTANDINPSFEPRPESEAYKRRNYAYSYSVLHKTIMTLNHFECDKRGRPKDVWQRIANFSDEHNY